MPCLMLTTRDRLGASVRLRRRRRRLRHQPFHLEMLARVARCRCPWTPPCKSEFDCGPVRLERRTAAGSISGQWRSDQTGRHRCSASCRSPRRRVVSAPNRSSASTTRTSTAIANTVEELFSSAASARSCEHRDHCALGAALDPARNALAHDPKIGNRFSDKIMRSECKRESGSFSSEHGFGL